ncbi:MAG TPA: hypothetical protein DCL48_10260 [Alphaproteobacteria bacterium]|nr:hypothetical protein [Alphaproteobacteria bacterium]
MSGQDNSDFGGELKRGRSWFVPLELVAAVIVIGAILYWFMAGPSIDLSGTTPNPTDSKEPVEVAIEGYSLTIPANYLPLGRNRAGGDQDDVRLSALLPDMRGWSAQDGKLFAANTPDSKVVQVNIGVTKDRKSEKDRFEKVQRPMASSPDGEPGPYGFTKFVMPSAGANGLELYTFTAGEALIVIHCETVGDPAAGPNCWRTIKPAERDTVAVTYRFKRSQLAEWTTIDQGVVRLLKEFRGETPADK